MQAAIPGHAPRTTPNRSDLANSNVDNVAPTGIPFAMYSGSNTPHTEGDEMTKHTCGGPVFGRKTAGCPRCDELLAGAEVRTQPWRKSYPSAAELTRRFVDSYCHCGNHTMLGAKCTHCHKYVYCD